MKKSMIIIFLLLFTCLFTVSFNIKAQQVHNKQSKYNVIPFSTLEKDNIYLMIEIYYIDISNYPNSVKLYCVVKDNKGNLISNLAPPYNKSYIKNWKSIIETIDKHTCKINDFTIEEYRYNDSPGFSSSIVLDYSGSMTGQIDKIEFAIKKLKNYIRKDKDNFDLIQFDQNIYHSVSLTNNKDYLNRLIPFYQLGGLTAFYDAAVQGLENIKNSKKEKIGIMFTDGFDNASLFKANDVVNKARKTNTKVFTIGLGPSTRNILSAISKYTNGTAFFPKDISEFDDIFNYIYHIMKSHYVITYKPECKGDNVNVNINFKIPNQDKIISYNRFYYVKPGLITESHIFYGALFQKRSAVIEKSFIPLLKKLAQYLKNNPDKKISIIGNSDSNGDEFSQIDISLRRAYAVYNFLAHNGVDIDQIVNIKGIGFENPVYPNDKCCEWKQHENRRVEIIFEN